jgi:hypothetical protein
MILTISADLLDRRPDPTFSSKPWLKLGYELNPLREPQTLTLLEIFIDSCKELESYK